MSENLFEKEYKRLNKEQKLAVDTLEGPVMVNAGPGTGKTQILTLRIGNILKNTDTGPENILALTFTNSGVYAMRERLRSYIGDPAYRVNIFTFHAFSEHLIKTFGVYFPQFEYAKVIDDLQKVKFIEEILDTNSFTHLVGSYDDYQKVKDIAKAVNTLKQEGYTVEQFRKSIPLWKQQLLEDPSVYYVRKFKNYNAGDIKPAEQEKIQKKIAVAIELADVYEQYQHRLSKEHLYDFSDMVITVVSELKQNENLKLEVQEQYQYILVDEHQDTNMGQNELIELLGDAEHLDGHPNIFTVGDEKQSIYRFQGASEQTFTHFNEIYKDIVHIDLKENYRSTQTILDASHAVIEHSIEDSIALNSNKSEKEKISIAEFSNYKFELLYLAQDIKKKLDAGIAPEEIAVLFRSNKHTEDIKSVLAQHKIPFTIFSKNSIFEDKDISNIILLLRVILNPNNEENLGKALFINFLTIDGYDAIKILQKRNHYKKERNITLFEMLSDSELLDAIGISNKLAIENFAHVIRESIVEIQNTKLIDFLKDFIQKIGYNKYMLASNVSRDKLFKIDKLFDEIKKQQAKRKFDIADFITLIDSYYAYHLDIENSDPEIESGVQLMTAHGSKGKEFEYVYLMNTTAKNWEKSRGFGGISLPIQAYQGDIHDERRLFYVSMTRARVGLCITYSKTDWEGKEQEKSRFVTEIPEEYISNIEVHDFEKENINNIALFVQKIDEQRSIYDAEFIKNLYLKRGLTVTALNNYLECPIKYFYKNLIQIPSGYSPILEYGNLMHNALEKYFIECKKQEKILKKKNLLTYYEQAIEQSQFTGKELEKYKKRGLEALESWFDEREKTLSFSIDLEKKIYTDFVLEAGDILTLNGKIDKIEYHDSVLDGPISVVDYKTGKAFSKKQKDQKEDLKRQLCFYNILLETYKDEAYTIEEAVLDFLEPNTNGEHERFSMNVSKEEMNTLKDSIQIISKEILSGELLNKGCQKKNCEWCNFHK
jgi:DNA helicase-2/ATP-dependent DNA helicase PcrA